MAVWHCMVLLWDKIFLVFRGCVLLFSPGWGWMELGCWSGSWGLGGYIMGVLLVLVDGWMDGGIKETDFISQEMHTARTQRERSDSFMMMMAFFLYLSASFFLLGLW